MIDRARWLLLGASLIPGLCLAAAPADGRMPPQVIALRVTVDAAGKVQTSTPSNPQAIPALNHAAEEISRKLTFAPAKKNGVAVPSETTLSLTLALEPRADGQFGLQLKRATNGPGVTKFGAMRTPMDKQGIRNGALVVVGVKLQADGKPDMSTLATERMELRVPSSFMEARYLDAITSSLEATIFELDKVDGAQVPAHVSVSYQFGGGPKKLKPSEEDSKRGQKAPEATEAPSMNASSSGDGIELVKIDYRAPDATAAAPVAEAAK